MRRVRRRTNVTGTTHRCYFICGYVTYTVELSQKVGGSQTEADSEYGGLGGRPYEEVSGWTELNPEGV